METLKSAESNPAWVEGWLVLRVKQALPGDLVSMHAHAEEAQADAHQRGRGHQVFHGKRRVGTDEFIVD
ncbi:hypothetical protein [Roseateles sp.]|uniref:hypothetical protein n=1 Tax=Roseateles sp. TaxID=1971397 RepID=UPI00326640C3